MALLLKKEDRLDEALKQAVIGLLGLARQYRLGYVPVVRERFDLLVERRAWFEPALQRFAGFCRSTAFTEKAVELGGPILLNMVMIGALCALSSVPFETGDIRAVLEAFFPEAKLEQNHKALDAGNTLISGYAN